MEKSNGASLQINKNCMECSQEIPVQARKCHVCGAYQRFNWFHFFQSLSSATAFILVIISTISLFQTCSEKQNAEVAAKAAEQAQKEAAAAKIEAVQAKNESIQKAEELVESFANKTQQKIHFLDQLTEFQTTLNAAQNDERKSFDQLRIWANDGSFPLHEKAKKHWSRIQKNPTYMEEYLKLKRLDSKKLAQILIDEDKRSLATLVSEYKSLDPAQSPFVNFYYIIYIAEHRIDISKKDRLSFLIDIIKSDSSLVVAKFADFIFWGLADKIQDKWFDEDITIRFWNENKDKY